MTDDSPTITQQYSFAVGEDGQTDGIEPSEESVETSLETFGADVDHRERDTRIAKPEASSFGVDDRKTVTRADAGEQEALFADTADDQQTLTGERAASQCLFETHDTPNTERDTDARNEPDEDDAISESDAPAETTSTETTPRALADGGHVEDHDDEPDEDEDDETNEPDETSKTGDRSKPTDDDTSRFTVGARVFDREADDPNLAVVVARPDEPAYAREIDALDGQSVADVNPDYPASDPVATVAYADDLTRALDVWREADSDALAAICDDEDVRTYDFPAERLRQATTTDGGRENNSDETQTEENDDPDPTFDPDAETVTEAWEGAFISAQWGYGQTNVELAQIVEVSDTGKTVLARKVGAERVEHTEGSEYLRPTAEQYGDEFRLHVRDGIDDEPKFRGSYPLGSDGDMNHGPTRRGWFYPFDNDPEATVRQTDPYHRH